MIANVRDTLKEKFESYQSSSSAIKIAVRLPDGTKIENSFDINETTKVSVIHAFYMFDTLCVYLTDIVQICLLLWRNQPTVFYYNNNTTSSYTI